MICTYFCYELYVLFSIFLIHNLFKIFKPIFNILNLLLDFKKYPTKIAIDAVVYFLAEVILGYIEEVRSGSSPR